MKKPVRRKARTVAQALKALILALTQREARRIEAEHPAVWADAIDALTLSAKKKKKKRT